MFPLRLPGLPLHCGLLSVESLRVTHLNYFPRPPPALTCLSNVGFVTRLVFEPAATRTVKLCDTDAVIRFARFLSAGRM